MKSNLIKYGAVAAAALAAVTLSGLSVQAADPVIQAVRVKAKDLTDPNGSFWSKAQATSIAMQPQNIATPMNNAPAIANLDVRSVHDGKTVAVLVAWKDATNDHQLKTDEFGDQVAIELPMNYKKGSLPSPMMGNPGDRVSIWQWRAALQNDADHGAPDIKKLYPNSHYDLYPDQMLPEETAALYSGATGIGNPVSRGNGSPVLEQMAEGFGSITDIPEGHKVNGRGVWKGDEWRVVFTYPLKNDSKYGVNLAPGTETAAAFAVWDGGSKEVGSRKAWSDWITLQLVN